MLGLGVFAAGCAAQKTVEPVSSARWPEPAPAPDYHRPKPAPPVVEQDVAAAPGRTAKPAWSHVMPRSAWARGEPVPSKMNKMVPVRFLTVHHDGMDPFFGTNKSDVAAHIESIRRLHRRKGWGDIGYHYAVDRAGRVWEGRPIGYQGAHVKDHNPGNIGIVVLGNFEQMAPSQAQVNAVRNHLLVLMRAFRVPAGRVHTHQEWQGAKTACPGTSLQSYFVRLRGTGGLG